MANNYGNNIYNLNCDSHEIADFKVDNNGLKVWLGVGIANKTLTYPDRREIITEESLFNVDSINTLTGAAITLNHPKETVKAGINKRRLQVGTILEQYIKDGDRLLVSGIIDDQDVIDAILKGDIKHTSSGYFCHKQNMDGLIYQTFRNYNHIAALTLDCIPRAGSKSEIYSFNPATPDTTPKANTDSKISPEQLTRMIGERVQLWTNWGETLRENNLAINYNFDASEIKRQILRLHYDDNIVKQIDDSNIDGFWLSFEAQMQNGESKVNTDSRNFKTDEIDYRKELIKTISGAVAN